MTTPSRLIALLIFSLILSGCASFPLGDAAAVASRLVPPERASNFLLLDLTNSQTPPRDLLATLRGARASGLYVALVASKAERIREHLGQALARGTDGELSGLHLIIVADRVAPELFAELFAGQGFDVRYGAYR